MSKLAITGHDRSALIDCSEAVPVPKAPVGKPATFPAGTSASDVDQSCSSPFPVLSTDRAYISLLSITHVLTSKISAGTATTIPECPDGDTNINDCPS